MTCRIPRSAGWLAAGALAAALSIPAPRPALAGRATDDPVVSAAMDRVARQPDDLSDRLDLGLALRRLGTIEGRRGADQVYAEALRRWPNAPDLLLNIAQLKVEQGFFSHAERFFRLAVAADSNLVEAHFGLARLALKDYCRFLEAPLLARSKASLERVLKLKPDHRDALYFGAFARLVSGDSTGARLAAEGLVERHPMDPWGYLLLEALAVGRSQFREADWARQKAFALLSDPREKSVFDSLLFVDWRAEEGRELRTGADQARFVTDFWRWRDPTPTTDLNERYLEHIRRIVVSDLFYGIREKRIRGWDTAPGEAIIRFGVPVARRYEPGDVTEAGFAPPGLLQAHAIGGHLEIFEFVDRNLSGLWLQPYNSGYPTRMDVVTSKNENNFDPPTRGPRVGYVTELAQFRGRGSGTRLEMTLAARDPGGPGESGGAGRSVLQRDVALYDRDWGRLGSDVAWLDTTARISDRTRVGEELIVDVTRLDVAAGPDTVCVASQIVNTRNHGYGSGMEKVAVRRFPPGALSVSDLMLLDRVGFDTRGGRFSRGGGWALPNPSHLYWSGENVPLYFEAYNLKADDLGIARYAVRIQVDDAAPPNPRMLRSALIDMKVPAGPRVRTRFEDQGVGPDLKRLLDVGIGTLPPGAYRLSLTVEDLASAPVATATSTALFRVVPRGPLHAGGVP